MKKVFFIWILTFILLSSFASAALNNADTYWSFDNNSLTGSNPDDLSSNGDDGTTIGATVGVPGILSDAFSYDGSNDAVDTTNTFDASAGSWTLSVWIDPNTVSQTDNFVWSCDTSVLNFMIDGADSASNGFRVYTGSTNGWVFDVDNGFTTGAWQHLVLTYDTTTLKMYRNAVEVDSIAVTFDGGSNICRMGNRADGLTRGFDGEIDEFGLWTRQISTGEIDTLYNSGAAFNPYTITPSINFTITATDAFDNSVLGNLTANITFSNGSSLLFINSTGNFIQTNIAINESQLVDIILSSTDYFDTTALNHNLSGNLVTTLTQSIIRFEAVDLFNQSVPGNFTVNVVTKENNTDFDLNQNLFNVTFTASGFFPKIQEINVTALDNRTIIITGVFDTILNITAIEGLFGNTIENFTVNILNANVSLNLTETAVGTYIEFGLVQSLSYTVTVSKTGFLSDINVLEINETVQEFEAVLYAINDVSFNFFDEITLEPTLNVSFDLFSNIFSGSFNTTNGIFNLDNIPSTIYEIRYGLNSISLAERSYFLIIPINSSIDSNLSLLTIEQNISFQFIRNVVDQNAFALEGEILEIQRPYPSTDNTSLIYRTVERALIDSTGDAIFTAIPNTQAYRFRVINTTFSISRTFTPTYLVETSKQLTVNDAPPVGQSFNEAFGISSVLTFNNASSFYIFDYVDSDSVSNEVCITTTRTYLATVTTEQQCSSESAATLLLFVNQSQNGSVSILATADISGSILPLDSDVLPASALNAEDIFQGVALIIYILLLIFAGTMTGYANMIYPIMFTIIATFAFSLSFLGMVAISASLMGGVFVLGILILIVAKK